MPDDVSETQLPAPFGKYLLTELIAVGGMAEVYKSKIFGTSGFEKEMVVKRILPRYAKNPNFVQMLIDEAKIAVNLTHGNIVPIYELGEFEGSYYIAMEFIEGQTILDVLRTAHGKRRKLPWAFALGICADVAAGLAYAHSRKRQDGTPLGLVHRDINPRNIVITKDGEVKILDFGIARASTKKHQTASGVIKGTPGYMSPEQMSGQAIDHRSDLYCLGILTHELLTLRRLFPAWTVKEMRQLFDTKEIKRPSELASDVPSHVDEVVMKALAPNAADRYPDAGELEEALREAIAKSGMAVTARGLAREIADLEGGAGPAAPGHPSVPPSAGGPTGTHSPTTNERITSNPANSNPANSNPANSGPFPVAGALGDSGTSNPGTQPMAPQQSARPSDADHAFVISLASDPGIVGAADPLRPKKPLTALEPLPRTRVTTGVQGPASPRTQVLAQNAKVSWAGEIGADAELLAIAKATGVAPGQTRNRLLMGVGVIALILVPVVFWFLPDIISTVERAVEGRKLRPGAIVVKTIPSGAEVILDGEKRGVTNISIKGIDPDSNHQLVVVPTGKEPIQIEFTPTDFKPIDGLPTYTFERNFEAPPEPEVEEPPPSEEKKPKKRRKRKKRRR